MNIRIVIHIDDKLCDGCGLCIPSCREGALQIVNGKAKLVKESYCDGLGACLGECPRGALSIVEKMADEFDPDSVMIHTVSRTHNQQTEIFRQPEEIKEFQNHAGPSPRVAACPSADPADIKRTHDTPYIAGSKLGQWPVQLHLVPASAPYFSNADLFLIADCVPFAYPDFHNDFLDGHAVAVACPKLDNTAPYMQKISDIIRASSIRSITSVVMEAPCCSGLFRIAREAIDRAGMDIPFEIIVIGIRGGILRKTAV